MKEAHLLAIVARTFTKQCIIFSRTKQQAHRLKIIMGIHGLKTCELHGDLTQTQRLAALEEFRTGEATHMVATDVAARGLDIAGVDAVVSYDAPRTLARTCTAWDARHARVVREPRSRLWRRAIVS